VLERVRVDDLLVDSTELLRLVDEGTRIEFSKLGQIGSLLYFVGTKNERLAAPHLV
jgi:hypothetical protein